MTSQGASTWFDRFLACVWALAVGAFAFFLNSSNYIPVDSADSFLVAFGLRPPESAVSLLWHNLVSCINSYCGIGKTMHCLYVMGPVSLALIAFISTRLFSLLMPLSLRTMANSRRWGRVITYVLPVLGSAVFVFSPAVWPLGEVFAPQLMKLLLFVTAVYLAVRAFRRSSAACFILTGVVSGLLAAESPIGFIIPLTVAIHLSYAAYRRDEASFQGLDNPLVRPVLIKWMFYSFVVFWVAALSFNIYFFSAHNAADSQVGFFLQLVRVFKRYGVMACSAMAPMGWAFAGIVVIAPVVFSFARVKRATDIRNFLFIRHGVFFFTFGVLTLLQSSPFSSWWFWRWISDVKLVSSNFLLSVCLLGTSYAAFTAICVFVVDVYFRNARNLARELLWDEDSEIPVIVKFQRRLVLSGRILRLVLMPAIVALVVSVVVIGRINPTAECADAIVEEYVRNVVSECSDKTVLITDGTLDAPIELCGALEGRDVKTLSIMSGNSGYEVMLRRRVDPKDEYRTYLTAGTADALRAWVRDDSPMASNLSVQIGFELWRDNRKAMPRCGGLTAKFGVTDEKTISSGVEKAHVLAEKILLFRENCDISNVESTEIASALSRIQWRLSRMCRMRSFEAARLKNNPSAAAENELADRLDAKNPEWQKVREVEDGRLKSNTLTLTPREGLELSLKRADFRLASSYAKDVYAQDENNVAANFALGMGHLSDHRYDLAEKSLKRALKNAPDEPAILNNLAVVLIRLDRFDEAESNAVKALKILPQSREIQETLRRIRELKEEQK